MQIDKLKPIINKFVKPFSRETAKTKPYTVVSRELNLSPDAPQVTIIGISSQKAATADKVVIAKTDNPEFQKIITTFRDKNGKIIERIFEYKGFNIPEKIRIYRELVSNLKKDVKGRLIQTFENLSPANRSKIWTKISSEKQFVHTDKFWDKADYVTITRVTTTERDIKPPVEEIHSITEYPVPSSHLYILPQKKSLVFKTKKDSSGIPQITEIISAQNAHVPKNDEYLTLRMYDADDMRKPVTHIALKKSNLDDLNINVEDAYIPNATTKGSFNHETGTINFNFLYRPKSSIVGTAFHEVKHAKQYEFMGRTRMLDTKYTTECLIKHGEETSKEAIKKGRIYYNAHKNYVSGDVNYEQYRANLLEQEAWAEAERGVMEYIRKGEALRYQFPRVIPEEL